MNPSTAWTNQLRRDYTYNSLNLCWSFMFVCICVCVCVCVCVWVGGGGELGSFTHFDLSLVDMFIGL